MTAEPRTNGDAPSAPDARTLMASAYRGLAPLAQRLNAYGAELSELAQTPNRAVAAEAKRLRKKIRDFEPSVTMIGQVKAGKTTLVNAMVGWPGLLPADVNPWTSVVTSLHLMAGKGDAAGRAAFQFFTEDEWGHLVQQGGRVGELAKRSGADDELEKVRRQLEEMREKSRQRLGRRFEMLLGQTHDYDRFDQAMIERYVCLGDDFWEDTGASRDQGRFADITRSADLWLGRSALPVSLCVRDTPGVNDTFMIREQITIQALRGSRLCVVVLSATQALSTVDLALIRMISNIRSRDVIIFVNRIDELTDPVNEVPEIRASISETLKRHDGPADAEIIFGSGFWAHQALDGKYEELGIDSAKALLDWAEATMTDDTPQSSVEAMVWHLSGMQALGAAIASRIESGAGARLEEQIEGALGNLKQGIEASKALDLRGDLSGTATRMPPEAIHAAIDRIEQQALQALDARLGQARQSFLQRIENSRQTFLGRATESLLSHLENYGEFEIWTYEPSGLRMLLRSGYQVFARAGSRVGGDVLSDTAGQLSALYRDAFALDEQTLSLDPPPLPQAPPPVALGQSIALDLRGSWWSRFWRRRRGYDAFIGDFAKLIYEETGPMVDALIDENADPFETSLRAALRDFIASQRSVMTDLAGARDAASASGHPHAGAAMPGPRRVG